MRVLCLVPYPSLGASNRLRVEQYRMRLSELGIDLVLSPFVDEVAYRLLYEPGHVVAKALAVSRGILRRIRDVRRASAFDLVLVHRESAPIGPPLVERALRRGHRAYVFDFDDAIFLAPIHPVNRRWAWLRRPSRVAETARGAAFVITGNEYLAAWARRFNDRVAIIPTPVDADRHRPLPRASSGGPIVIGWVGSSTTAPYLHLLDRVLDGLGDSRIVVRVIGGHYAHPRVKVECLPYDLEAEPRQIATFDIGVLPEPDDAWTRGKGALKALLYMATGLPVVASNVGVNPQVVLDGVTGYCVGGEEDWVSALRRLIDDPDLRARLGAAGRRRAEEQYSVSVQAPRVAEVLRAAAASRMPSS